jgi:hypothetical protein
MEDTNESGVATCLGASHGTMLSKIKASFGQLCALFRRNQ